MGTITTDGFTFDLPTAKDVYEFDCDDKFNAHYHGFKQMKAVDVMAEYDSEYLFIEVKDFYNPKTNNPTQPDPDLLNDLKYKYRDSYLYQLAHGKVDKPIYYICVLEHLDHAMMLHFSKCLGKVIPDRNNLPAGWKLPFLESAIVVSKSKWNQTLSRWGAVR